jgi:hypothetical protein
VGGATFALILRAGKLEAATRLDAAASPSDRRRSAKRGDD